MKRFISIFFVFLFICLFSPNCGKQAPARPDYPVAAVPLSQVDIIDDFWAPREVVNRTVSLQHVFKRGEETRGGGAAQLYEAAGYILAKRRDPDFQAYMHEKVNKRLKALAAREAAPSTGRRYDPSRRSGGTSAQASVAYYEGTGDRRLLDRELKSADLTCETYGPGKEGYISGHEGQKIGLITLSTLTGEDKYWKLAKFLLDIRGKPEYQDQSSSEYPGAREYNQNHRPVVEQTEAVGHCVRAMYLYIPLTDIAALTGEPEYAQANLKIWEDVVARKMYLPGGIGSIRQQEKFGAPYELPNHSSWQETCASYGMIVWNHKLFLLHRDAKFIDIMERVLYNGFLVGVSLSGDRFFYQNVLKSFGNYERFDWINVPCCPPNVVRLIAQLGSYIYAQCEDGVYVNLFVGSQADIKLGDNSIRLTQQTRYPWEGKVKITVDPAQSENFAVYVRIPGWAQDKPVPSDLYTYLDPTREQPTLSINGEMVELELENGYIRLDRKWSAGDVIDLNLPMPIHKVIAHENVLDDRGRLALERGPLVYCAEWPDNGGSALNLIAGDNAVFAAQFQPNLLNGVTVLKGEVEALVRDEDGVSVKTIPHQLVAIPYYSWANRGMGEMVVWMARTPDKAWIKPIPPDPIAAVNSSGGIPKTWTGYNDQHDDIAAVYDGVDPLNSADNSHLYFRMRPPEGEQAWVEYQFKSPTEVSFTQVYFADDQRFCRLPEWWRIVYKDRNTWKPVSTQDRYRVDIDKFNTVAFDPVKTTAIRIEVEPQSILYKVGAAGPPAALTIWEDTIWREFGIIEWRVK
jgi:DUF1680 family protein